VQELSSWLRDLQDPFANYADKFEQAGMVGELLMYYTEPASLDELIPMQGDRDRLWLKILEAKKLEGKLPLIRPLLFACIMCASCSTHRFAVTCRFL
jgi:hypothetical protein